jgi:single-strand DNA-binding protein
MNGLAVACTASVTRDAETRNTRSGDPWVSFSVVVDGQRQADESATFARVSHFGPDAESLAAKLIKGAAVYVEGALKLGEWVGRDGEKKAGLNITARRVEILGEIGRPREQVAA